MIVTVEGIGNQSMQAFLRRIAARLSVKWQKPLSTVSNWVCARVQFALIKVVDLRTRGSREVEELGVRGWRGDCHSLPEIVGCAVFDVLY